MAAATTISPTEQPDDDEQDRGLDVVGAVDRERVVRVGEEEVERDRRDHRGDRTAGPTADHRGEQHHDHEHQGDVGGTDVVAEGNQRQRDGDRREDGERPGANTGPTASE